DGVAIVPLEEPLLVVEAEEAGEAAGVGDDAGAVRAPHQRHEAVGKPVLVLEVDAGGGVGEGGAGPGARRLRGMSDVGCGMSDVERARQRPRRIVANRPRAAGVYAGMMAAPKSQGAAAGGDGAAVVAWLAGHDASCPVCGYNARGLATA